MGSRSLGRWAGERAAALDEIEGAHASVGGTDRGRRYATQQINYAYAALLSAHFQGFCRDLHTECVDHFVAAFPTQFQAIIQSEFTWNRGLSRGNPHPGAIGSDFGRLGINLWPEVCALDARNSRRRELLQQLIEWRNAIVHHDFDPVALGSSPALRLVRVRRWRRALDGLAQGLDRAMYNHCLARTGTAPW